MRQRCRAPGSTGERATTEAPPTGTRQPAAQQTPLWPRLAGGPGGGQDALGSAAELAGNGRPLDRSVAAELRPRLGFDLSTVRIHDDPAAGQQARNLGALAFTWGPHVAFAPGAYQPHTSKGHALIAHELAHVVQQLAGSGAPEQLQEAEADGVQRGGALALTPTGPPRPVLRLAVGDALALTVVVGPDGSASFSAEVDGGGIATGSGTATNLGPGEYRVRWADPDMIITNPDGSKVPSTSRFDIPFSPRHNTLVRALQQATTAIPLYVRLGPAGGRLGSAASQRQRIAALPERLRTFLFTESGGPTRPEDYPTLLRIAESVADLSEDELAEFLARTTGSTTDVAAFEVSVHRWLAELRARRSAEREHQAAKDALTGLESLYELYRAWSSGVAMWGGVPGFIQSWEALPASELPADHGGELSRLYLVLRRSLAARGWANLAAFETSVARFVTAFREHAYYVALDLLGRYEHTLLEQQQRYQTSGTISGLHTELAPARTTIQKADAYAASARATYGGSWDPADVMAYHAAGAEYQRQVGQARGQVRSLSGSHPLLVNRDFPLEELGRATSEAEVRRIVRGYLTERLANVRDTRSRLAADHELIFKLDVLVADAKARQGIADNSIWDKIIRDRTAPTLDEQLRDMMILTLTVALGIATAGTGSLALAALSFGIGAYQAVQTYQQYAFERDAYGAQLLAEEPSLAWVVLAVVGASIELGGVAAMIRPAAPGAAGLPAQRRPGRAGVGAERRASTGPLQHPVAGVAAALAVVGPGRAADRRHQVPADQPVLARQPGDRVSGDRPDATAGRSGRRPGRGGDAGPADPGRRPGLGLPVERHPGPRRRPGPAARQGRQPAPRPADRAHRLGPARAGRLLGGEEGFLHRRPREHSSEEHERADPQLGRSHRSTAASAAGGRRRGDPCLVRQRRDPQRGQHPHRPLLVRWRRASAWWRFITAWERAVVWVIPIWAATR